MTTQIEVGGDKNLDDVNRKNVNRGDVHRKIAVHTYRVRQMCFFLLEDGKEDY